MRGDVKRGSRGSGVEVVQVLFKGFKTFTGFRQVLGFRIQSPAQSAEPVEPNP
jgi:hypothetical protein